MKNNRAFSLSYLFPEAVFRSRVFPCEVGMREGLYPPRVSPGANRIKAFQAFSLPPLRAFSEIKFTIRKLFKEYLDF